MRSRSKEHVTPGHHIIFLLIEVFALQGLARPVYSVIVLNATSSFSRCRFLQPRCCILRLCALEEASVGGLLVSVSHWIGKGLPKSWVILVAVHGSEAFLVSIYAIVVYSVWASKKSCIRWILLCVFPSAVRPTVRNEVQVCVLMHFICWLIKSSSRWSLAPAIVWSCFYIVVGRLTENLVSVGSDSV